MEEGYNLQPGTLIYLGRHGWKIAKVDQDHWGYLYHLTPIGPGAETAPSLLIRPVEFVEDVGIVLARPGQASQ